MFKLFIQNTLGFAFAFALLTGKVFTQTFYQEYGSPGMNEEGSAICASPDGNMIVGGARGDSAMVMKVSPTGAILWTRTFAPLNNISHRVTCLTISPDNFIVGVGTGQPRDDGFYFKIDLNGNVMWSKTETHSEALYLEWIDASDPAEYLMIGAYYYFVGGWADPCLFRVDALTGNILSNYPKHNFAPIPYIDDVETVARVPGQGTYTLGRTYLNGSSPGDMRPFIIKYDLANNLAWSNFYLFTPGVNARMYGVGILQENDSLMCSYLGNLNGTAANFTSGVFKTDLNGVMVWGKDLDILSSSNELHYNLVAIPGGYVLSGGLTIGANNEFFMIAIDPLGNVIWGKSFGTPGGNEVLAPWGTPCVYAYNSIWLTGKVTNGGDDNMVLLRSELNGDLLCNPGNDLQVSVTNLSPFTATLAATATADIVPSTPLNTYFSPLPPDNCQTLNLGPDILSCNPVLLDATTPGAIQYSWQDGSSSPTFNATAPGIYWVNVTVACCILTDTIEVLPSNIMANLGPDIDICQGTITVLNAGFPGATYLWSDNSTNQTLNAGPGLWWVQVTQNGCVDRDSIVINSFVPPNPDLGPDLVLCGGGSLTLNAGVTSNQYLWSNGAVTQSISVNSGGTYWVQAFDIPGCIGYDTIIVTITPAPVVNLGNDETICEGQFLVLDAMNPGSFYEWSTGETTQTISVGQTGTYSVIVTSPNTCADTAYIHLTVIPDFQLELGPDLEACIDHNGFILDAGISGLQYLWSTGEGNRFITLMESGTYQLTAWNECFTHLDSVGIEIIPSGIGPYLPNIFTPNGDGLNEIFPGPNVYEGESYHLLIFDRWGKIIFESFSPNDNWDGYFAEEEAAEGVYAFVVTVENCQGIPGDLSGTVMLLR